MLGVGMFEIVLYKGYYDNLKDQLGVNIFCL